MYSDFDYVNNKRKQLSFEEKQKIMYEFNNTVSDFPVDKTLHLMFEEQVEKTPNNVCLFYEGEKLTYDELDKKSDILAELLRKNKIGCDSVVGLITEVSLEMIIGILGILKAGGAYLPIDCEYPEERVRYILEDSKAELLLTQTSVEGKLSRAIDSINLCDKDMFLGASSKRRAGQPEDLAYVIYTSGSTGNPKGVMIQHNSAINQIYGLKVMLNLDSTFNHILMAPYTFDASVKQIFLALISGATLFLPPKSKKLNPSELIRYMSDNSINIMNIVPSLMSVLLDAANTNTQLSFKCIMFAGEVFSRKLYKRLQKHFNADRIYNIYGPTEATINATYFECKGDASSSIIPIGRPLMNYKIYILDEDKNLVGIGEVGEIYISGVGIARGYINKPEMTAEKFLSIPIFPGERLYMTGDLGKWLEDGNIEFLGRIDHQVKVNGIRIELGEIEARLLEHDAVKETIVLDKEDSDGNKRLWVYIVSNYKISVCNLREHLSNTLPDYMLPSFFVFLDAFPITANGKINRKAVCEISEYKIDDTEYSSSRNHVEERLSYIWQKILKLRRVGLYDNFYQIGGSSIDTIKLNMEIQKEFNVKLGLFDVFNSPTIKELALLVNKAKNKTPCTIDKLPEQDYYNVTHSQKRMWVLDQLKEKRMRYNTWGACSIEGGLDIKCLESAFVALVDRHESLRTIFVNIEGELKQRIIQEHELNLVFIDLKGLENAEKIAEDRVREASEKAFRPDEFPLLYVELIRLKENSFVLLASMHHIISDGWSMKVFVNDLLTLYSDYSSHREASLKKLRIQYKDYANWFNEYVSSQAGEADREFWRNKLGSVVVPLNLPVDFPRPEIKSKNGSKLKFALNKEICDKISKLAVCCNTTLFMTLLAPVYILLYHYTMQTDIVIGTLVSGREHSELEALMGYFVNTVPLRININQGDSFERFLLDVKKISVEALEHQLYPFDNIFEGMEHKRELNRSPIFDVELTVEMEEYSKVVDGYKQFNIKEFSLSNSNYEHIGLDLSFYFKKSFDELEGAIIYSTDIFERSSIELMKIKLITILERIAMNPKITIAELDPFKDISDINEISKENEVSFEFDL